MSLYLLVTFYATMVVAGLVVETLFGALGLVPNERNAKVVEASPTWNYTSFLNIPLLVLTTVLVVRFLRIGGPAMLRMMSSPPDKIAFPMVEHSHGSNVEGGARSEFTCPMHPEVV